MGDHKDRLADVARHAASDQPDLDFVGFIYEAGSKAATQMRMALQETAGKGSPFDRRGIRSSHRSQLLAWA